MVEYLKTKGFKHYSARNFIVREIESRGMPVNRDSMAMVANDLRAIHSPSYIIESLFNEAKIDGTNAVIESIRTEGEINALRTEPHFVLLAVNADPKVRYDRIVARGSVTDQITFEKFQADETREMTSTDPHKQNLSRCIALADHLLNNDGTKEELYAQVDTILGAI